VAQTKTRGTPANGSDPGGRAENGSKSRTKKATQKSRSTASTSGARKTKTAGAPAQEGGGLGEVASKAKVPMIAGGVALAGLTGVALSRNGRGKSALPGIGKKRTPVAMPSISMPKVSRPTRKALGATAKAFGDVAVEVGKAGYRVGELASEVRRVREQAAHHD